MACEEQAIRLNRLADEFERALSDGTHIGRDCKGRTGRTLRDILSSTPYESHVELLSKWVLEDFEQRGPGRIRNIADTFGHEEEQMLIVRMSMI